MSLTFDLEAPIVPAQEAAGIRLDSRAPSRKGKLETEVVRLWFAKAVVSQISVRKGYRGCLAGTTITIGSTIEEIEAALGEVVEDEADNLAVVGSPGWCFETELWQGHELSANKQARVVEIFVFHPDTL